MTATVELAKKLGFISYIKLNQSQEVHTAEQNQLQYLFVIDFESTCWEQRTGNPPPEIIEFPVVLLCLRTGEIKSEFHQYCSPVEHPRYILTSDWSNQNHSNL